MAGDAGAAFEIDEVVLLGERDVILDGEAEGADVGFAATELFAGVFAADGGIGVREVGHRVEDERRFGCKSLHVFGNLLLHFAKAAAFVFAGITLGVIFRFADRLADFICQTRELFRLGVQLAALGFEVDEAGDVGFYAAVVAVALNEFGIFEDEALIKHEGRGVRGRGSG